MLKIGSLIALLLLIVGGIPELAKNARRFGFFKLESRKLELPLEPPVSLAVSQDYEFYVLIHEWCRIQVYERDGTFKKGFPVPMAGGMGHLDMDKEGNLQLDVVRSAARYTFDDNGRVLNVNKLNKPALPKGYWEKSSRTHYELAGRFKADIKWGKEGFRIIVKETYPGEVMVVYLKDGSLWTRILGHTSSRKILMMAIVLGVLIEIIKGKFSRIPKEWKIPGTE